MPLMSSPATVTLAVANSRSIGCGGEAGAAGSPPLIIDIACVAALISAASDCTCSEYSPGAMPDSEKLPSLSVRDVPPGAIAIASFIVGISITSAPLIGLPSEPTAVPVIRASRTGCNWMSTLDSSWPSASATRCASAAFGVPG